jgi:hypothetical protein
VSYSSETRTKALYEALAMMVERRGEKAIFSERFALKEEPFSRVPNPTWRELEEYRFVEACGTIGHPQRRLTGSGWFNALIVTRRVTKDEVLDPDLKTRLSKLTATMKDAVKGRREDAYFYLDELEAVSGLPKDFIINVMESGIIDRCFKIQGAEWEDHLRSVRVPLNFGLRALKYEE